MAKKKSTAVGRQVQSAAKRATSPRNPVIVKPVVNAIQILRYLTQTNEPARAVDIARHLGINASTCFNTLRTLVLEEVVDFSALSKRYSAGLGLMKLAEKTLSEGRRLQAARPLMHQIAERFHVTVTLWRRMGQDRIVLVSTEANPDDLRIHMSEGQRLPILMGASGRLFAAALGYKDSQMRNAFASLRWSRPLTFEAYWREVMNAKRRGWAVDDGYFSSGIMAIAAPVLDPIGQLSYTASAIMFRGQHDDASVAKLGEAMRDMTARLSRILY